MDRLVIRSKEHQQELSGIGARESEMDIKDTIGQRIDQRRHQIGRPRRNRRGRFPRRLEYPLIQQIPRAHLGEGVHRILEGFLDRARIFRGLYAADHVVAPNQAFS